MKKIFLLLIVILIIIIIFIFIYINKNKEVYCFKNSEVIDLNNDMFLKKISDLLENDRKVKIENNIINKTDLEIEKKYINIMESLSNNPTVELLKQNVLAQEALKEGINITEKEKQTFYEIEEKEYIKSNKTITKNDFIEQKVNFLTNYRLSTIFIQKFTKKIDDNDFQNVDEEVLGAVKEFENNKTRENLQKAYDTYAIYLCKQYKVFY